MKKLNYNVLTVLLCVMACNIIAQPAIDDEKAHRRYWYYRARLINDFMKIGSEQGDCIVFPERNMGNGGDAKVGPDQIDITNQYLAALALEYKLLSRNNQSTAETLKEIYYLLHTINRLDSRADWFWLGTGNVPNDDMNPYPETANLNGFILREDMPGAYISSNLDHFNYGIQEDPNTNESFTGLTAVSGLTNDNPFNNYAGFSGGNPSLPKTELSWPHDKYYSMFIAFMLLIKYIPDNTSYSENSVVQTFQDGLSDIKAEVRAITARCHSYLRGNTFGNNTTDWVLEYPDGTNLTNLGQPVFYSYPLSKMICYIMNGYPWGWPCNSEQDAVSLTAGFSSYNVFAINPIPAVTPVIGSEDAAVFLGYCMAGSNAPVYPGYPTLNPVLPLPVPACISMDPNTSLNNVEWADLLRRVLHQSGTLMKQKSVYTDPINVAPCIGPFNFSNCNDGGFEWSSQDRNEHPKSRGKGCSVPGGLFSANYPGIDYMFLHNLYYEYLNQEMDDGNFQTGKYFAYNLMDNYDEQTWPQSYTQSFGGGAVTLNATVGINATYGSNGQNPMILQVPAEVKVFQNLSSRAQIYATTSPLAPNNTIGSRVNYRAGKEIALLPENATQPGFKVDPGSEFSAIVKRYLCRDSDYGLGMRGINDTVPSQYDYETDSMNTTRIIHYISSPLSDSDLNPYGRQDTDSLTYPATRLMPQNPTSTATSASAYNYGNTTSFEVIPNPNNGVFKIAVTSAADTEQFTLTLIDTQGKIILQEKNYTTGNLDLTSYPKGIYLVRITSSLGFSGLKKVNITE